MGLLHRSTVATRAAVLCLMVASALAPSGVRSQERDAPPIEAERIEGSLTLYGWLPWLDGRVSTGRGEVATTVDPGDILDSLKFAFMASGDLHRGRFGIVLDTVYSKVGNDNTRSGPFSVRTDVDTSALLFTAAATYKVMEADGAWLEVLAGGRVTDIDTDVSITGGGPLGVTRDASAGETWVDPLVGLRGRLPMTGGLSAIGFADIGGFGVGSDLTWEVFGGLDYSFTDRISGKAGFRYISIDYTKDGREFDLDIYGPAVGVTVRF